MKKGRQDRIAETLTENYISSILINATAVTVMVISLMKNNTIYNGWKSYQKKPYKIKT